MKALLKKTIPWILCASMSIFTALSMSGCVTAKGNSNLNSEQTTSQSESQASVTEPVSEEALSITDFFPLAGNRIMYYEGKATVNEENADTEFDITVLTYHDYIRDNKVQQRTMSWISDKENTIAEVYEIKDGRLSIINGNGSNQFFRHDDITGEPSGYTMTILSEPFEVGGKWIRLQSGENTDVAEIISMDAEVTVPWGTFKAMAVKVENEQGITNEYYVKDLGLVKIERESPTQTTVQELAEVQDTPLEEYIQMFYQWDIRVETDDNGEDHFFMEPLYDQILVSYDTNADVAALYTNLLKECAKERFDLELSEDARLNGMYFDPSDQLLRIDITNSFLEDMKKAGDKEGPVIQLMADSFGYVYNAMYVTFSVDGQAYVSDTITIDPANDDVIEMSMYKDAAKAAAAQNQ